MTNLKPIKRALLSSVLALLVCFSMLVGTTFAWFTDSVTSNNNIIQTGTLNVGMYWAEGDEDPASVNWTDAAKGAIFNNTKWEPGYVEAKHLEVVNEGTLALKFKLLIVPNGEVSKLADVIDVYYIPQATKVTRAELAKLQPVGTLRDMIDDPDGAAYGYLLAGESETVTIALKMRETAGNEYQNLSIGTDFSVQLLATQYTYEDDSLGNDYDEGAMYPNEVNTATELTAALQEGGKIKLVNDIALLETVELPANVTAMLDLNGKTLIGDIIAPNANLTIANGTIADDTPANSGIEINAGTLNLENVDIESARHALRIDGEVTATINGGTYKVSGEYPLTTHALNVSGNATVTINGGTFIGIKGTPNGAAMGGSAVNVQAGSTVIINGGNFSGGVNDTLASKGTLIVKGGTFDQDPSNYATGSQVIKNENGTWTVKPYEVVNGTELNEFIEKGATNIVIVEDIADVAVTVDKSVTITGEKTLNNVSITASGTDVELTVSELNFIGNSWINANNAKKLTVSGVTANVAPSNGSATNSRSAFISLGSSEQNKLELVVENCNVVLPAGISGVLGWAQITKATITGNTFGSADAHIQRSSTGQIGDAVKVMSIANGAVFTVTGNTVYTDSNGFAFAQNTTRDNAYTVVVDNNTFYGTGDHIWVEVSGTTTTKATIQATSNNTVNGNTFTAADIKSTRRITDWTYYAGVDVITDESGKLIGGTFVKLNTQLVADGYVASQNADGTYTVVAE